MIIALTLQQVMRKTAEYVDRILHGEKPGDLPVQMPTKFKLIVNLPMLLKKDFEGGL